MFLFNVLYHAAHSSINDVITKPRSTEKFYHLESNENLFQGNVHLTSASARISKGQGYQGFLRKRAGSSFGQKKAICIVQRKT
jgi:hypothetical protein